MKRYFVETSAIIDYLRGREKMVEFINHLEGEIVSSFVCLAELYEGIFRVKKNQKAELGVLNFFAGLSEIYSLDREIAKNFGRIRSQLRKQRQIIEDLDILIAATCLTYNLILVTKNLKHFNRVKGLAIHGATPLE